MCCLSRWRRFFGRISRTPANHSRSLHAQSRGDAMFASTSEYMSSGKTNISMSDNVAAEDFSSSGMSCVICVVREAIL